MAGFEVEYEQMMTTVEERIRGVATLGASQLQEVGDLAIDLIQKRTRSGKDYRDESFEPYSSSYAEYREQTGRNPSPVSLEYEGIMLGAMTRGIVGDDVRLYFSNSDAGRIAQYHNAGAGDLPERRFFDVAESTNAYRRLAEAVSDMMREQLQ